MADAKRKSVLFSKMASVDEMCPSPLPLPARRALTTSLAPPGALNARCPMRVRPPRSLEFELARLLGFPEPFTCATACHCLPNVSRCRRLDPPRQPVSCPCVPCR
eukprot:gene3281-biopygen3375